MSDRVKPQPTLFQRRVLPGFAYKAVVIGGGYATGRELVEFFLPSGPQGGLLAMLLAAGVWSLVCVVTFLFARLTASYDYRSFFRALLGPAWPVFEVAYALFIVVILAVFGAAAGEIGARLAGLPTVVGTLALMSAIALFTAFGNTSVERLFKYVSIFLYAVYVAFVALSGERFGGRIAAHLAAPAPSAGWIENGLTYAGYNIVGAAVILPVVRHMTSRRDALIAGLLAGPLAMLPAVLFFVCMVAYYPEVGSAVLPSDFLLERLGIPAFRIAFQVMIFAALLESGAGAVNAINERIAASWRGAGRGDLPLVLRLAASSLLLVGSMWLAQRFGLVTLIARGYRLLAWVFLAVYVAPLLTVGVWRLRRAGRASIPTHAPARDATG